MFGQIHSQKRPLINAQVFRDWVFWLALGLSTFFCREFGRGYFYNGKQSVDRNQLIVAPIASVFTALLVFVPVVTTLGLFRRLMWKENKFSVVSHDPWKKAKILGSLVLVAFVTIGFSYVKASNRQIIFVTNGLEPGGYYCKPVGNDYICVFAPRSGSGSWGFVVSYGSPKKVGDFRVNEESWLMYIDCNTKSVHVGELKFDSQLVTTLDKSLSLQRSAELEQDYQYFIRTC
jgi:hypothetical protein